MKALGSGARLYFQSYVKRTKIIIEMLPIPLCCIPIPFNHPHFSELFSRLVRILSEFMDVLCVNKTVTRTQSFPTEIKMCTICSFKKQTNGF